MTQRTLKSRWQLPYDNELRSNRKLGKSPIGLALPFWLIHSLLADKSYFLSTVINFSLRGTVILPCLRSGPRYKLQSDFEDRLMEELTQEWPHHSLRSNKRLTWDRCLSLASRRSICYCFGEESLQGNMTSEEHCTVRGREARPQVSSNALLQSNAPTFKRLSIEKRIPV